MPAPSRITPDLISEVATRRTAGEPWKVIANDLRARGLPHDRATWWRSFVAQHIGDCSAAMGTATRQV